jgi:diaminohydroxyphosphoribosylaminopyrimidine deaminase/5-amino-6-(5-phosphoribosylamino)uracil reductase
LKMAQTLDGRIATLTGDSQWISSPASLKLAHELRAENDAVMVGAGTVRADNPALTVRLVKGKNPYRIVVSGREELPSRSQLFVDNHDLKTVVVGPGRIAATAPDGGSGLVRWDVRTDRRGRVDLNDLSSKAAAFGLQSILVEGGSGLATALLEAHLVDKLILVVAPKLIGHGTNAIGDLGIRKLADGIILERVKVHQLGPDQIVVGYPKYKA